MTSQKGNNPVTAVVIGAGCRGSGYPIYSIEYPDRLQIIGVADPRKFYRERLQKNYNILDKHVFEDWKDIAAQEKFADCAIICTPDRLHKDPAVAMAKKGYHILLEKPMAVNEEDCKEIVKVCKENNVILAVCHVLRYTPWAMKLRELIKNGAIGDIVNIQHLEPVGYWHFAHAFVRGNWRREDTSTFSLLAKCCHDFDLITYWMGDRRCVSVSSFGQLTHFNKENKPKNAANRCLDCPEAIESVCPYSAKQLYLGEYKMGNTGWPVSVIAEEPDIESITEALKTGPYGVCVYDCDNDVMSQQVVNMQFEDGPTATLSMIAFTESVCVRETKIFGTKGELRCKGTSNPVIDHVDFSTGKLEKIRANLDEKAMHSGLGGHGGADYHCVDSFVSAVMSNDQSMILSGPDDTLASHLLVFAAEKARKENIVVNLNKDGTF